MLAPVAIESVPQRKADGGLLLTIRIWHGVAVSEAVLQAYITVPGAIAYQCAMHHTFVLNRQHRASLESVALQIFIGHLENICHILALSLPLSVII